MKISFGKRATDVTPTLVDVSFEEFSELVRTRRHHGTMPIAQYLRADRAAKSSDKDGPWFIAGEFVPNHRRTENLAGLVGFVGDFDDGAVTRRTIEAHFGDGGPLRDVQFAAWTSYSHGAERKERWRLFIPYTDPITRERHHALYEHFNRIFEGHLDASCDKPAQLWYLPGCPPDAVPIARVLVSAPGARPFDPTGVVEPSIPVGEPGATQPMAVAQSLQGRDPNSDLTGRAPLPVPTLREVIEMVSVLPKEEYGDGCHDAWVRIGMAVHNATQGSENGLRIFDRWSSTLGAYDPAIVATKWRSFGGRADGVTVASLVKLAREAGWSGGGVAQAVPAPIRAEPAAPQGNLPQAAAPAPAPVVPIQLSLLPTTGMPDGWKNHSTTFHILKEVPTEDGLNTQWRPVIAGCRLMRVESLESWHVNAGHVELEFQMPHDPKRIVRIGSGAVNSPKDMHTELSARNVYLHGKEFPYVQALVMDWLKKIQQQQLAKRTVDSMGWIIPDGKIIGFATGEAAYYVTGVKDKGAVVLGGAIAKQYVPQGDYNEWKKVAGFLAQQNKPALVTILASAFAAPLVRLSGLSGAVLSIVSTKSGVGKSSAVQVAQAVWGSKDAMHSATDTNASFMSKLGTTNNLPMYWDDIKGDKAFRELPPIVYQITQGRERARLDSSAKLRDSRTWDVIAVMTANDSILDLIKTHDTGNGSDATIQRVFEIRYDELPGANAVSPAFFDPVRANYGHAGAEYAAWLAQNSAKAQTAVEAVRASLTAELTIAGEERFWVMIMACLITGASIATALGIVKIDVPSLRTFLKARFEEMRVHKVAAVAETSPENLIADMVADFYDETLHIAQVPGSGRTDVEIKKHTRNNAAPKACYAIKERLWRVRQASFHDWVQRRQLSASTIVKRLEAVGAIQPKNADLAGGTALRTGTRLRCYEIDLSKLGINVP